MKKTIMAIALIAMTTGTAKAECIGPAHLCGGDPGAMAMSRHAQASRNYALISAKESRLNSKQEKRKEKSLKRVASGWKLVDRGSKRIDRNTRTVQEIEDNQRKRGVMIPAYKVAYFDMQYKEYKNPMKYKPNYEPESDWVAVEDRY